MIKRILLIIAISLALLIPGIVVLAQDEVPPPYAGLKNPISWDDASAQAAGKQVYQQNCLGCHGVKGNGLARADFSATDYPQRLEQSPDLYYWILSEGKMEQGMPPYKTSLSDEQRWQSITYIWTLGKVAPVTPPPKEPSEAGSLQLNSVGQIEAGQPLTMSATLHDKTGKPIPGVVVSFFTIENFFATGLMSIGDAITNDQGVAIFTFVPRHAQSTRLVACYGGNEASTTTIVTETDEIFYRTEAGIRLPAGGPEVFIGPQTATEPPEGQAPTSALRLPGGLFSLLWLFVAVLLLVWGAYFRVLYQVFQIPATGRIGGLNLRLVPQIGLVLVTLMGVLIVIMVITGPYSQFHLSP